VTTYPAEIVDLKRTPNTRSTHPVVRDLRLKIA
jgi:hypothetical protein